MKMHIFIIILLTLLLADTSSANESCKLRFAPLPMESRETIVKQFKPMLIYLQEKTGCKIDFEYSDSYAEILNKMKNNLVDIAYLGPLPYVTLKKEYNDAFPIVLFNESTGEPKYTCCIIEKDNSKIDLSSLTNTKIALTQPLSTCGFLSTNGMMRDRGNSLKANFYKYLDRHDDVALSVARGEYNAGGLKTAIAKKYTHLGLNIISETDPLPGFALVVNRRTVNLELSAKIHDALMSLDTKGKDAEAVASWGANIKYGASAADDNDYNGVRKLLGNETIPEAGNF